MPKLAQPLTDADFRNAKPGGQKPPSLWKSPTVPEQFPSDECMVPDGKGLNLRVRTISEDPPECSKVWIFRYRFGGKEKNLAIKGGYPSVSLKQARAEAERMRGMVSRGEDPGSVRKAGQEEEARRLADVRKAESVQANTFEKLAREFSSRAGDHLDPQYAQLKLRQLEKNVFPWIGARPIAELRAPDILTPLRLVEDRGARESAHRILGFCGEIFRYAVSLGVLDSDPTRDLRGVLKKPIETHFAALTNPEEVGALLRAVAGYTGNMETRVALRLGILTFVRPGNLRMAEWSEFHNLDTPDRAEWRIPGEKMKVRTGRAFVVPLARQAVDLVERLRPLTGSGVYLFPSPRPSKPPRPMSNNTVNAALRRMGFESDEMTGHGVRAMARTLCHEALGFAPEVLEEQLAHGKAGPLGGAYDRTTHMPERRRLMQAWADYLDTLERGEG
ncbi:MAG: integrase arm-type DNA-binding domain-containing protein [Fibrobacterota bacterium]|nr:MAG: integrase arm-type DNA-binding domain-containing protein [Fibrobacterota bacterium]